MSVRKAAHLRPPTRDTKPVGGSDSNSTVALIAVTTTAANVLLPSAWGFGKSADKGSQYLTCKAEGGDVTVLFLTEDGTVVSTAASAGTPGVAPALGWKIPDGESEHWLVDARFKYISVQGSASCNLRVRLS
ncbi:MAG: hypothetical protein KC492_20420 [Myxococcales bacterium]|nr:hypothetical protein [Myxococcales bacterium]